MEYNSIEHQREVIHSLDETAVKENLSMLRPIKDLWQPSDFLPDFHDSKTYPRRLIDLREKAAKLDDSLLVVLIGNMVTEEGLPSYPRALNVLAQDDTGIGMKPLAQ